MAFVSGVCAVEDALPPDTQATRWQVEHADYHQECRAWWTCRLCEPPALRYGRGPLVALPKMEADVAKHLRERHS